MAENKKVIISIVVDDKSAKKNLNEVEKSTKKAGESAKKANKNFFGLGKTLGAIARGFVIVKSFQLLARAITESIKILADFELQMKKVKVISGATDEEFKRLEKAALSLGLGTQFTATQVAELQLAYAKLGFTTQEIIDATEATTDLATITGDDLANSADVVGATIRGFGLDAVEASRVVDVMANSFSSSALNLENFKQSMKTVAPIANAANISLEQTTAMLSVLADAGLRGTKAATGLKNLMSQLTDPTSELARELGYTVNNSEGLAIAFDELVKKNIDLTKATGLTDERSKAQFLTLLKGNETVKKLTKSYEENRGKSKEMADEIEESLTVKFQKFVSAIEGFVQKEGTGLLKILGEITDKLTILVNGFNKSALAMSMADAELNRLTKGQGLAKTSVEDLNKALERYQARVDKNNKFLKENKDLDEELVEITQMQTDANQTLIDSINKELKIRDNLAKERKEKEEQAALKRIEITKAEQKAKEAAWAKDAENFEKWSDKQVKARIELRELEAEMIDNVGLREKALIDAAKKEKDEMMKTFSFQKMSVDQKALLEAQLSAKIENLQRQRQDRIRAIQDGNIDDYDKYLKEIEKLEDEANERRIAKTEQIQDEVEDLEREILDRRQELFNVGFDLLQVQLDNRLGAIQRANEQELNDFERLQNDKASRFDIEMKHQLDSFVGTEQQKADFEKQKSLEQLEFQQRQEAERDKLRQKQLAEENKIAKASFRANKINSLANIAIDTAKAVAGINANPIVNADITQALRTTLTQLVTGIGIAQGAVVASQRFQPKTFQDGGMIQGESHANGGVPFTVAGQAGFEAEGGEYIFSRKTVNRLGVDFLDSLNFGQRNFADGGFVAGKDFARIQAESRYAFTGQMAGVQIAELARVTEEKFTELSSIVANIRVTNVATDTAEVSSNVLNAQAMATL